MKFRQFALVVLLIGNLVWLAAARAQTSPTINYAQSFGESTSVTVGFSVPLDSASATNTANYFLNNGISILGARLLDDGTTVLLKTTPLAWGNNYTLTVNNVGDQSQPPNTIIPNSQRAFLFSFTPLAITQVIGGTEPAGPSSRRSAFAISEIMYHPTNRLDGRNLEYVEIYNSNPWVEDLGGHRLSGDVEFTFPAGTTIPALGYRVIAVRPADLQAVYGLANVLGPLTNSTPGNTTNVLANGGGTIRLRDELNALLLEVNYDDEPPWPAAPDGAGHALVLARPSYGEGNARAWAASDRVGGSPGGHDLFTALVTRTVLINEILAHTDEPQEDFIELFNYSTVAVNLGGCVLTDDPTADKFRIAANTTIPPRGFLAFSQSELGFALGADGETVYFIAADGSRVLSALRFGDQENGIAYGRFPDGAPVFRRLESVTQGTNNTRALISDLVINELQFHPASDHDGEEFVEIHNRGANPASLAGWRLSGGVSFTFPAGTTLAAGGHLVVANDKIGLLAAHTNLNAAVLGNYSGKLANSGDVVRLDKPDDLISTNQSGQRVTNQIHITVDEVAYLTGGRWGRWADGGGSSLERTDPRSDGSLAPNWADSDETGKSAWTTVEFTGLLDHGAMASADQLQILLLGAGECLVDNVEVIPQGGANLVANGTFNSGTNGWAVQGTHQDSIWQSSGGFSGGCLRVVASGRGDVGANRIRTPLTQAVSPGTTATLRARVRWLKGHPEILLRLYGNWLEAAGDTLTTRRLGTPAAPNSQFRTNAGPAITGVSHSPVLPTAGQAVTVSARVEDPDGVAQVLLRYRVDPASNYVTVAMNYAGAGYYSAVIPGQGSGVRAAFYLEARDAFAPNVTSRFPGEAPTRECLVSFGETTPPGNFWTYRLWVSQRNVSRWTTREKQSNHPLDATFVYGGSRICYNVDTLYSGSPWHTPGYNSPIGNACDYEVNFAKDDNLLGAEDFLLATIGNLNSDPTYQAEQTAFWIGRKLGVPYLHRRYMRMYFNGQLRGAVYEDAQQPSSEVVNEFFPDDDAGSLHKIEDWFEFDNSGDNKLGNVDATLENFTTSGGAKKTARYRWNWRPRATREAANAFTNLFALVDALHAPQPEPYRARVSDLVDVEEFMRVLAMERIVGNWDSYGHSRGKNMYAYKPANSGWVLFPWDIDFVLSSGGSDVTDPLFGGNEPLLNALREFPEFQRAYWRAFEDAVNGPLQATTLAARLDPRYSALIASGVGADSPAGLKGYAAQRRSYILNQLATVASPFVVNPTVTVSNGVGVLSGVAPIKVATVTVNGAAWSVRWTSVSNWVATVPIQTGSNFFSVAGLDVRGQTIAGASNGVALTYNFVVPSPVGAVVINEIMFNPLAADAEYVELFNTSTTNAFDLSGWTFNGLGYTFPNGVIISPRGFLVLAKNRAAFSAAYGANIAILDEFGGNLQADGETLSLLKPGLPAGTFTTVDRVRYEAAPPWPAAAPGTSLQLRDPSQDNSRVADWTIGSIVVLPPQSLPLLTYTNVWKFMQVSNLDGVNWTAAAYPDASWPGGPGLLAYEDNSAITPLIRTPLNPPTTPINNVSNGHAYYFRTMVKVTNDLTGFTLNASAYLDDGAVFYVNGEEERRVRIADGTVTNRTFTTAQPPGGDALNPDLFTFDPSLFVSGTNVLAVEVHQNQANSSDIVFGLKLDANFAGSSNFLALTTPGKTNSVMAPLAAFPPLWLNEAQADNVSGPLDNAGEREPWIELFNTGTNALNLGGYYLSDNYTNLSQWAFPSNASVPARGFVVVWCDNQPGQTTSNALHANFRLPSGAGRVALSRIVGNTVQLLDYLTYTNLPSNWSYGDTPDAQPFYRGTMFQFTPGATNSLASPPLNVFINEWMADNTDTLADPAEINSFEDWFEIYNPGTNTVDLGGYYLTDNLTDKTQFLVPNNGHYLIPPGGFLLVWADNESGQNHTSRADLHADFALSKGGEAIGIFAADGTLIDAVSFGSQVSDVSQGRFLDGSASVVSMTIPTPRLPNVLPNTAPTLAAIGNKELTLGQTLVFNASAADNDVPAQLLNYGLGAEAPLDAMINSLSGEFRWTPTAAPSTNTLSILVSDNGTPSLSATQTFRVTVYPPPTITAEMNGGQMQLTWPRGMLQEADDVTGPYSDVTEASPVTVDLSEVRKFYRIRL